MALLPDPEFTAYKTVPKRMAQNLAFRREIVTAGYQSEETARALWTLCKRDPLFYINSFVWTYDPRLPGRGLPPTVPFITYEYQDEGIKEIIQAVASHDLLIEKSRDMGASWIALCVFDWFWRFHEGYTFLMLSRKEEYVDKRGDRKALFWKLDFIMENLPAYLRPNYVRSKLHLDNLDTGSTIDGESTTGDAGRGDRRSAILADEFASVPEGHRVLNATRDATTCRIFNSTPKGRGNAFYDLKQTEIKTLRFHWSKHPYKSQKLYRDSAGKMRSPWYDMECKRAVHPMEIAQELDIDYAGSDSQFFEPAKIEAHIKDHGSKPLWRGRLEFDPLTLDPLEFKPDPNGPLMLWFHLTASEKPPAKLWTIGSDIATGSKDFSGRGASNSTSMFGDARTREKLGALVCNGIHPHEFAKMTVALARWLRSTDDMPAFMIWEANGPGRIFGETVTDLGYRNIFYRRNERSLTKSEPAKYPGFYTTRETKVTLLGAYRRALESGEFINHDADALHECLDYVYTTSASIEYSRTVNAIDPAQARDNHGDRVIGDALLNRGFDERALPSISEALTRPRNSIGGRRLARKAKENRGDWW